MRFFTLFLMVFSFHFSLVADVYKWQEDGRTYYSDSPSNDPKYKGKRQKMVLPELSNYKPIAVKSVRLPAEDKTKAKFHYQLFIITPKQNQKYSDNTGTVEIEFESKPHIAAYAGHKIEYQVGSVKATTINLNASLDNIDRGKHTISAKVIDRDGKVLSNTVTLPFYVKRDSVLIKKNLKVHKLLAPRAK